MLEVEECICYVKFIPTILILVMRYKLGGT